MKKKCYQAYKEAIDIDKYGGEWICLIDGKIIAHGKEFRKVAQKAEKMPGKPIFEKVPEHEVTIL